MGRIRSERRVVSYSRGGATIRRAYPQRVLAPVRGQNGYERVDIRGRTHLVHRLVAAAFLRKPRDAEVVNHLDGARANNHAANLEYATYSENTEHAILSGRLAVARGEAASNSKLTWEAVRALRAEYAGKRGEQKALAAKYGASPSVISSILNGRSWKEGGAEPRNPEGEWRKRKRRRSGHRARLRPSDVRAIRKAKAAGESASSLAERFGVSARHVYDVASGASWPNL